MEEERIDVCAASPWVELAQGLIRDQQRTPPQAPSLLPSLPPQSHRICSHYSGADRWASLCISAVHFLKSEKPIHLGQTQEEEGAKEKLKNSFFSALCQRSSVIHELSEHFVSPSLTVSAPQPQPTSATKSWGDGNSAIPLCLVLHVDKFTKDKGTVWRRLFHRRGKISHKREKMCLCFLMDWINLCFSGTVLFRHSGTVVYLCLLSNRIQAFSGPDK